MFFLYIPINAYLFSPMKGREMEVSKMEGSKMEMDGMEGEKHMQFLYFLHFNIYYRCRIIVYCRINKSVFIKYLWTAYL